MRLPVNIPNPQKVLAQAGSIVSLNRKLLAALSCLMLIASLLGLWRIKDQAQHHLDQMRELLDKQSYIPFEKKVRLPLARSEIQFLQSTKSVRAVARFGDSYFCATTGGLVELSLSGKFLRHYTVLDGLTESDLVSLAPFNSKLYIGTQTRGLIAFDGERFESYRWLDREPQAIAALLEDQGRLLVGTFAGGLIEFDGARFKEIKVGPNKKRLAAVNFLAKDGPRLYVGTFNDGLWLAEAGRWLHFTTADGLLSNRIVGIVARGESVFVASDYGLAICLLNDLLIEGNQTQRKRFRALATLPSLSSLIESQAGILFGKDNGEIFALSAKTESASSSQIISIAWDKPAELTSCRLAVLDKTPWLLSGGGIWRANAEGSDSSRAQSTRLSFASFGQLNNERAPSSNLISALAFDAAGQLWAGSFRNGIDIFTTEGRRITHLESDSVREINFLAPASEAKGMLAATSQGVIRFDPALRAKPLTTTDGLLSNSVSHVAVAQAQDLKTGATQSHRTVMVFATSRGLSMGEPGKLRGLTTVQGLPSNSLYTALPHGRSIYAGTLGGLAEIRDGKVVRVFKDANSNLTHNWVTGICAAGPRLFIGTYGGGIFELTAAGELRGFSSETGKLVVNPNAMWSDGERLYAGTLDGAWMLDLNSQQWIHLRDELPSPTVLSITGDRMYVYFGTTSGIARIEKSGVL